jgi:hypothetical protein
MSASKKYKSDSEALDIKINVIEEQKMLKSRTRRAYHPFYEKILAYCKEIRPGYAIDLEIDSNKAGYLRKLVMRELPHLRFIQSNVTKPKSLIYIINGKENETTKP